ncbi:MAG: tetratricopeptide repeat protein [SAR324 cluster bacterium]|nr:tetratricopeptide repeat protein [SAR324 cluster bacterium]
MEARKFIIISWVLVLISLSCPSFSNAEGLPSLDSQISMAEMEDRNFIQGLFKDKKHQFAFEEAGHYLKKYPKGFFNDEMHFIRAQVFEIRGKEQKAMDSYQKVLVGYPTSNFLESTYFHLGQLKINSGETTAGEAHLEELKERFPFSEYLKRIHFSSGQAAYNQKEYSRAIPQLRSAYKDEKLPSEQRIIALNYLAWSHFYVNDFNEAEKLFKRVLKSKIGASYKPSIAFQMGRLQLKKDNFKKARAWFINQKSRWPDPKYDAKSLFWYAESVYLAEQKDSELFSEWDKKEALKSYSENLAASKPYQPRETRLHRGWLRLSMGLENLAQEDFAFLQNTYAASRKDNNLSLLRANLYYKAGDFQASSRVYEQTLSQGEGNLDREEVNFLILRNDFKLGQCDKVVDRSKVLGRLKEGTEKRLAYDFYTGVCSEKIKDCKRAVWHFRVIPVTSQYGREMLEPALACYRNQKRSKEAIQLLTEALKLKDLKNRNKLIRTKGQTHMELSEWPQALVSFEELVKVDPKARLNPWVHLEVAKCHDQLAVESINSMFEGQTGVLPPDQHEKKALAAYDQVSKKLGGSSPATQLSILEIRRERYKKYNDYNKVIELYEQSIPLISSPKRKDELILEVARFHLNKRKDPKAAENWALRLHDMAARSANFEATLMLADLSLKKKDPQKAVKLLKVIQKDLKDGEKEYFKVNFKLAEILQAHKKWKESLGFYQKVAKGKGDHPLKEKATLNIATIKKHLK